MTFITANKKVAVDDVLDLFLKELDIEITSSVMPDFDGFALSLGKAVHRQRLRLQMASPLPTSCTRQT